MEKLLTRDGSENGYPAGTGDLSSPHEDSGAGFCQYTNTKAVGPLYHEREDQGKHTVVTLLYGT